MAPSGTIERRPPHWNSTYPLVTCNQLLPSESTSRVYAHPRSTAVPDGVSTKNRRGGASTAAAIVPRASASR